MTITQQELDELKIENQNLRIKLRSVEDTFEGFKKGVAEMKERMSKFPPDQNKCSHSWGTFDGTEGCTSCGRIRPDIA